MEIHFIGLNCFVKENGGYRVALPDGTSGEQPCSSVNTDAHMPFLLVDQIKGSPNWPSPIPNTAEGIFPISKQGEIVFGNVGSGSGLDVSAWDSTIIHMKAVDPDFALSADYPSQSVANIVIKQGTLRTYVVNNAICSILEIPSPGGLTITSKDTGNTIEVEETGRVYVANVSVGETKNTPSHFLLYYRLADIRSNKPACRIPTAAFLRQTQPRARVAPFDLVVDWFMDTLHVDCSNTTFP